MVGFLKEDVRSDSGFFEQTVVVHGSGGNIYVYPSDGAVFMFDAVNRFDTLQIVVHRVAHGIFPGLQCKPFMSHILQCDDFFPDLFLSQLFSGDMFIFQVIRAIGTAVHTVVGKVERRKHDDSVSVEILFDLFRQPVDFLILLFDRTGEKNGCFPVGKSFS